MTKQYVKCPICRGTKLDGFDYDIDLCSYCNAQGFISMKKYMEYVRRHKKNWRKYK